MNDTQETSDQSASQVIANDVQELSQIIEGTLAPLSQMSLVQLSQNFVVREKAQQAVAVASGILEHLNNMLARADALTRITKTVHFQNNGVNPRIQAFKEGVAVVGPNGSVSAEAILDCDFVFIGDLDAAYDPAHVTICDGVHIVVSSDELHVPTRLTFWSGGTYHLYHGLSLSKCAYLHRTTTLTLK